MSISEFSCFLKAYVFFFSIGLRGNEYYARPESLRNEEKSVSTSPQWISQSVISEKVLFAKIRHNLRGASLVSKYTEKVLN